MAGDWIKMRGNLWDDPRVGKLCDLTDCTEAMVIGGLYWLWATADQHTEDGVMPGLSLQGIDRKSGVRGLGEALCQVGWLADHPEGVRIIKFEEHNGASAKRRSSDAQRKAGARSGEPPERKYIPAGKKAKIFAMDGFRCVYCNRHKDDPVPPNLEPSSFALSVDHIVPVCKGGDNSDDNLVTACLPCNMSKNGRTPEEWGVFPDLSERIRTTAGQSAPNCGAREEKRREEKNKSKENKFSSDDMSTAEFLWHGVQRINPNHKVPKLEAWADSVRLMRERDGRPDDEIRALFTWANQHRFWAANVLSPDKLRDQYDRLTAQRNQEIENAANQPIPFNRAAAARRPILDHDDTSWIEDFSNPNRL